MEAERKDTNGDGGGFLRMPLGFKFDPRNQAVVVEYLRNRVLGLPLPFDHIRTECVYSTEPWNLIPPGETDACYFSPIVRRGNSKRLSRRAGDGSWTANGKTVVVVDGKPVARKQLLTFHYKGTKKSSGFVMHEYELTEGPDDLVFCWIKANAQLEKQLKRKNNWGSQDHRESMEPPSHRPRLTESIAAATTPMFDHSTSSAITCQIDADMYQEFTMQHPNKSTLTWFSLMQFMGPVLAQQVKLGIISEHQQQHLVDVMTASYLAQQQSACSPMTTSTPEEEKQQHLFELETIKDTVTLSVPGPTEEEKQFYQALLTEGDPANGSDFDLESDLINCSDFSLESDLASTSDFELNGFDFDLKGDPVNAPDFELDDIQLDDFE